jgi:hypothetical protein
MSGYQNRQSKISNDGKLVYPYSYILNGRISVGRRGGVTDFPELFGFKHFGIILSLHCIVSPGCKFDWQ